MKKLILAPLILCVLCISCVEARKADESVIAFNDRLVERLKVSQAPFEKWWETLAPWYAGERLERAVVEKNFAELRQTHQRIYAELLELEVPEKEVCEDFYDAVMAYLAVDREIIAAYEGALKYIFANNPAANKRDISYVNGAVDPVLARQEAILERIALLQEKPAETHGLTLRGTNRINVVVASDPE